MGITLRGMRANLRLNQKDVARYLKMNVKTYQKKESLDTALDVYEAKKLADLYGITLDELYSAVVK